MTISDEEIEELKKNLKDKQRSVGPKTVLAILARLEAAENVAQLFEVFNETQLQFSEKNAIDEWRKASGK